MSPHEQASAVSGSALPFAISYWDRLNWVESRNSCQICARFTRLFRQRPRHLRTTRSRTRSAGAASPCQCAWAVVKRIEFDLRIMRRQAPRAS